MDDLINRQDVLNLCDMRNKYKIPYEYDDGSKHIKGYDEGRIINVTKLKMLPSIKPQPCEDAISREDALMALTGEWTEITDEIIHRFIRRIKKLPPVKPQEPKTDYKAFAETV